jgi:hypothetical protein
MNRNIGVNPRKISLAAMLGAFTLLFLYIASVIPTGRFAVYFLSSVFVAALMVEYDTGLAFLMFVAVSLLSFLILPDRTRVFYYILFFGHYGIGKHFIEKIKDKVVAFVLKLLYFNAAMGLMYLLATKLLVADTVSPLPVWVLLIIAQIVFVVYDYLYSMVTQFYVQHIRKWLIRTPRS